MKQHRKGVKVHELLQTAVTTQQTHERNFSLLDLEEKGKNYNITKLPYSVMEYEPVIQKRLHVVHRGAFPEKKEMCLNTNLVATHELNFSRTISEKTHFETKAHGLDLFESLTMQKTVKNIEPLKKERIKYSNIKPFSVVDVKETRRNLSGEDNQPKLFNMMSRVLGENAELKKNLEICKKIINVYQSSVDESLKTMLNFP